MNKRPPGLLRAGTDSEVLMMVCTAGHVDHGKTQLVKLLTGCSTDRLKTEQERGLTIELGFAPCFLGGGASIGIVDVPGHERFVKNMVAGVSGIDMTLLVIAADDGIMPQTLEHFQIMELLGVPHGMVVLTKIDLVPEERLRQVTHDIRGFLNGTFMQESPICPVSSQTFEGYPEFYDALVSRAKAVSRPRSLGVFRMPVAHVFSKTGYGTVVTGIPIGGSVRVGDTVELVPGNRQGRVTAMQQFLRDTDSGECGQCLALNIPDFGRQPPIRGQMLGPPGWLEPATTFHVRLRAISGLSRPVRHAEEVRFHAGTSEVRGKIFLLEAEDMAGGGSCLATVVVTKPVAAAAFDRFIIRRLSPAVTIAGGEILSVYRGDKPLRKKALAARLNERSDSFQGMDPRTGAGAEKRTEDSLRHDHGDAASVDTIAREVLLKPDIVSQCISRLHESGRVLDLGAGSFIHAEVYRRHREDVEALLERAAAREGILSMTLNELRRNRDWTPRLWQRIQRDLELRGVIKREGDRVVLEAAARDMDADESRLVQRILTLYQEAGYHSPRPDELPERLSISPDESGRLLDLLCARKELVRLSKNVVLDYDSFRRAQDMVVALITEHGTLDSADFKQNIDSSRKYALAILDFLDSKGITVRSGNLRRLAPNYKGKML
jgi:selenocysteine-specific elongation factor